MMLQASGPITRSTRNKPNTTGELESQSSYQDDENGSLVQSHDASSVSFVEEHSVSSPLPVVDSDVLRLADAIRPDVVELKEILSPKVIGKIQTAVLERMADRLSEQELFKLQDERMNNDPVKCWCCDHLTQPPPTLLSDAHVYPVFVISATPEWLLPAMHCGNLDCPGRQLGLQAKPKYGDGMTFEHAGLLTALYVQRQWRPVSWFLMRDPKRTETVTEVDSGLTLTRITLAVLFRILKPYDDFAQECERQQNAKKLDKQQVVDDDRSNQENECNNPSPNLPTPLQPSEEQIESALTIKENRLEFEECRRSLQVEELDGCARIIWNGTAAAGFCTYSVRMDANYGVYAMLNGIYVRRCFRRRGLARKTIQDFFRVVAPGICRQRNGSSEVLMAIQAPLTKLILTVITNSLELEEMARIKCVRAQCPLALSVSVKSWASVNRGQSL